VENIEKCECWVGIWWDDDVLTLEELKEEIERYNDRVEFDDKNFKLKREKISLNDFCGCGNPRGWCHFEYCPKCGKKIDWKTIKGDANG
jgi:hypothetical protein